jgi:hypothetical protein
MEFLDSEKLGYTDNNDDFFVTCRANAESALVKILNVYYQIMYLTFTNNFRG